MWEEVNDLVARIRSTATKADLLYVVCIWKGPFGEINHRVGYFESTTETAIFGQKLHDCYTNKFKFPHVVHSNVASVDNLGNLEV